MCELCKAVKGDAVIADEGDIVVTLTNYAAPAVLIIPKEHALLEELPRNVQEKLLATANTMSSVIFDQVQVHGTNILTQDREHASYLVVGRMEEDGLELRWKPNKATPTELSSMAGKIKDETWTVGKEIRKDNIPAERSPGREMIEEKEMPMQQNKEFEERRQAAKSIQEPVKQGPKEEHNYLIKQLTRKR